LNVLSIDYRLAPEDPFPAAVEDALASFRFAVENAGELGADPGAPPAVGGDSAGGNLAAVTAQLAGADGGPEPAFSLLIYPATDFSRKRRSYELFADGFLLPERETDWYRDHYLPDEAAALDPRASPLLAEDLSGQPPTYVATAGFDVLRDEGEEYAKRLRDAGIPVGLRRHPGLMHGFANMAAIGGGPLAAMHEAAGALRMGLARAASGAKVS
jgi:acetyl esterase/lipase